ncbi:MAG TPA: type 4a pilus biogenesis protein PilO [Thermoanaerobaculia bacterium]|nr:type 4a pilus biogenesis protein PilO [Thermoanaerobaculia bacterium]
MKALAVLIALAIPPAVYFTTFWKDRKQEQAQGQAELQRVDARLEAARAAQTNMSKFFEENASVTAELQQTRIVLPPTLKANDILRTLQSQITAHGVQLIRFEPRPPADAPPLQRVSVEAEVAGPPSVVRLFLHDLTETRPGERILTVSEVKDEGDKTSFVVTGYALPD